MEAIERMIWTGLLVACAGCYLLKLAGLSVPPRVLENERVNTVAALLPVALLSSLIAVQTVANGRSIVVDARLAGVVVAAVAQSRRLPFLVVVGLATVTAAALRLVF